MGRVVTDAEPLADHLNHAGQGPQIGLVGGVRAAVGRGDRRVFRNTLRSLGCLARTEADGLELPETRTPGRRAR